MFILYIDIYTGNIVNLNNVSYDHLHLCCSLCIGFTYFTSINLRNIIAYFL